MFMLPIFTGLVITAVANRIRGGGFGIMKFRLGIAAGLMFAVAVLARLDWPSALAITAAYVFWDSIGPWGRWLTMNNHPRSISGDPSRFEKIIEGIAGDSDFIAMTIRMYVGILGFCVAAFFFEPPALWMAFFAPVMMSLSYWGSWKLMPLSGGNDAQIHVAEMMVGVIWGCLILCMH